eukprot:c18361_g1_i1 orf=148-1341(+)
MDIVKPLQEPAAHDPQYSSNTTSSLSHSRLTPAGAHSGIASLLDHAANARYNQAGAPAAGAVARTAPLSVRFAAENEQLELPPTSPSPSASAPINVPSANLSSHGSISSSISSSSVRPRLYTSTTTTYNSSSTGSSPSPLPRLSSGISTTPELASPPDSAFVSASASPISPPFLGVVDLPPEVYLDQAPPHITSIIPSPKHPPPPTVQQSIAASAAQTTLRAVDDTYLELQFVKEKVGNYVRSQQPNVTPSVEQAPPSPTDSDLQSTLLAAPHSDRPPPTPIITTSPSASFRPRTCDVYIGIHGYTASLSRFSKWLRAELEFQGIACFLADRARYTDPRIHDIARHIMQSCTFGVIVINKKSFKNLYSVEELQIFLERKNLVPLFFDLAPADCMARD